jgi:predicted flap endonuclease-1-like 5' DNA nuclease
MASITAIEGIGPRYRKRLEDADIRTCEKLLEAGATRKGRKRLADTCGLSDKRVLEWVNRADLMRINGVSTQYSDLLEAAGVDTVKELRRRKPANLHQAMLEANERRKTPRVRQVAALSQVERWVGQAKELPAVVKY